MAASLKVGGYQCKFIDELLDDFLCQACRHVARQPHLTTCCGEQFCHTCIAPILQDKKPCPSCKTDTFTAFVNKRDHRKILALRVCCTMKERGCQWTGKVEQLDIHLDVKSGDCQYVDVECPEKCGQQVQKHQLASHITNKCPKRDFACMYCGFKATYEVVSEQHWPECQNYPVPCPNRCQIGAVERNTLEDHLNMCRLQIVDCDFSYAGCNEKLQRQDMEKHIEENTQKHLALMASASIKMSREFKQKLQEQQDEIVQVKRDHEERIKAVEQRREEQIKSLKVQSQQQVERIGRLEKQLKEKEQELEQLNMKVQVGVPPFHITMPNFKIKRTTWDSPHMYTHPHGYKFIIEVWPNGAIYGNCVGVVLNSMPGEFDATLQWPAKLTITLQLFNQHRDQDHITVTKQFQWKKPEREKQYVAWFTTELIAHTDLELNAQKQTQYLKDGCLHFRITKIVAQK